MFGLIDLVLVYVGYLIVNEFLILLDFLTC